jgi:hypothetical protein
MAFCTIDGLGLFRMRGFLDILMAIKATQTAMNGALKDLFIHQGISVFMTHQTVFILEVGSNASWHDCQ